MLSGVDISVFQGQIDWDTLKRNANFVIIQSSYGNGYIDKQFYRNRDEARRVQVPHGFYHFCYPQYNQPQLEAEWFLQTIGTLQDGELLALDFEQPYADPVSWCKDFLDHVSLALSGYKPLLYINASQMKSFDWSPVANAGYGLWLAEYNEKPEETSPLQYWKILALHQWESTENVPGIVGNVDADVFFGDNATFNAYGYHVPLAPTPPTPSLDKYKAFALYVKQVVNGKGFAWDKINTIKKCMQVNGI